MWCVFVLSGVLDNEALSHWWLLLHKKVGTWYSCYMFRPFLVIFREVLDKKNTLVASYTIDVRW